MAYNRNTEMAEITSELKSRFKSIFPDAKQYAADRFLETLEKYIDAKIDAAKADTVNRINKTGEYDPDY